MSVYPVLKQVHVTCVALSFTGFCLRGWWMIQGSPRLQARWVRVLPHLVDTLLLGSAIAMAVLSSQYPFVQGWLTAKLVGLLSYILCGTMALKRGRTPGIRLVFFALAVLSIAYIVSVALTRNPLPYLAW